MSSKSGRSGMKRLEQSDGWTAGWVDGCMGGWMDGWMDGMLMND